MELDFLQLDSTCAASMPGKAQAVVAMLNGPRNSNDMPSCDQVWSSEPLAPSVVGPTRLVPTARVIPALKRTAPESLRFCGAKDGRNNVQAFAGTRVAAYACYVFAGGHARALLKTEV